MRDRKSHPLYGRHYMSGGSSVHVPESNSVQRMRSAVGHVIYACEMPDGTIKIGWTSDFGKRKQKLGADAQVLALWPGTLQEEQEIHAGLVPYRARGHEYYHRTPEVLSVVNDMRSRLSLEPVT